MWNRILDFYREFLMWHFEAASHATHFCIVIAIAEAGNVIAKVLGISRELGVIDSQ